MTRVALTIPFLPFPKDAVEGSVPVRFEHIVRQYPRRLAVKTTTHSITYEALNQ